ncbi:MAG: flavin-containing monooxygenase [Longimicrobiales bacterium]
MEHHQTIVIGAGPAGLAAAACLTQRGCPFLLLEQSNEIGSSWRRHYDRLHLHTTRGQSHLPGLPLSPELPQYVPRAEVVAYLDRYVAHYGIEPRFGVRVARVVRSGDRWIVTTEANTYGADNVVVGTGFNRRPRIPSWPGEEGFGGPIRHSVEYRNGADLAGQRVLVVGMGNTGAEVALDLYEHGAQPSISVRGPVNIVPRDILGRPTAKTALMLKRLPPRIADPIGTLLQRLTVGDLTRFGIRTPQLPPLAQLRELGQTPVIDVGTVRLIKRGLIGVLPAISEFLVDTIRFADGSEHPFDHVVLATGYDSAVTDFVPEAAGMLNRHGHPAGLWGSGQHEGLYFIGFDGYSTGGVLQSIRLEAPQIADRISRGQSGHGPVTGM